MEGGPVRRTSSDEKAESLLQKIGGSDSSHVECLLFQMVDYHEYEGAKGSKQEAPRKKQPTVGRRPKWLKPVRHRDW